jgi:bifunctional NMN adenylyltransferase/nudix hydrolase
MEIKTGVVIGRFQPLHEGHKTLIREAMLRCDRLIILVGSVNKPRSIKNPWTFQERRDRLKDYLSSPIFGNALTGRSWEVKILPVSDHRYTDSQWVQDVLTTVDTPAEQVTLFGMDKKGNDYLKYFPQWKYCDIGQRVQVCGTDIRKTMLKNCPGHMPPSVVDDYKYFKNEKKIFENYPFKATLGFCCADNVLECAGHVLLILRKKAPGAGTWAFPGGFKNADETFRDCALRELTEETNVRVPEKVLRGSIVREQMFDAPDRGCGIPRITMAVHMRIDPEPDGSLPRVSPADDAMEARWVPIADAVNNYDLFDDHGDILQAMTGCTGILASSNPRFN